MKILLAAAGSHGDVLPAPQPGAAGARVRAGPHALVGSSLAWATRLLGEIKRAPVATVHLAPAWLRSEHRAPSIGPLGHLERAPALVKRLIWRLLDRRFLDPLFTALLPRLAALVHHGGIGTTSQALLAGLPQLVRPMGFDQFDNARRVLALGVARQLLPRQFKPAAVARTLDELTAAPSIRARCAELAKTLAAQRPGTAAAADALLALASHGRP